MIAFLKGKLAGKTPQVAYIDVNGVGYAVFMSATALSKLPESGGAVTVQAVGITDRDNRDAGIALYGFLSEEEKATFERLIGVTGVGPKVALAALSTFSPRALADAVAAQDVALVQKIPGVGKKSASRIILELKGSFDASFESLLSEPSTQTILDDRLKGATEALLSMGFTSQEAELALKGAPEGATEAALLQYALKRLGTAH